MILTLVTGSADKLAEWQRLAPTDFDLRSKQIDLEEIQSLDPAVIIAHKVRQAYEQLKVPVAVEDVSAGFDDWAGLPGPFIKFFEQALGEDALYRMAQGSVAASVICSVGYFDGTHLLTAQGSIKGLVVPPRGANGFGFDKVFMPSGHDLTFAEMSTEQKDAISHRRLAVTDLFERLKRL